jgi:hypothetical protein
LAKPFEKEKAWHRRAPPCAASAEPATRFEALARAIVKRAEDDPRTLKLLLAHLE